MTIKITNNSRIVFRVGKILEKKQVAFEKAMIDEVAEIAIRTLSGTDVEGKPFEPYTPKYAEFRKKKGRTAGLPNLSFTGNMLAAMRARFEKRPGRLTGIIGFLDTKERKKALGNQEHRNWFGLPRQRIDAIINKIKEA